MSKKSDSTKDAAYVQWRNAVVVDPEILGGEPVFPKSRLAVRRIGGLRARGMSAAAIRKDYPFISVQDVAFAYRFVREMETTGIASQYDRPHIERARTGAGPVSKTLGEIRAECQPNIPPLLGLLHLQYVMEGYRAHVTDAGATSPYPPDSLETLSWGLGATWAQRDAGQQPARASADDVAYVAFLPDVGELSAELTEILRAFASSAALREQLAAMDADLRRHVGIIDRIVRGTWNEGEIAAARRAAERERQGR